MSRRHKKGTYCLTVQSLTGSGRKTGEDTIILLGSAFEVCEHLRAFLEVDQENGQQFRYTVEEVGK